MFVYVTTLKLVVIEASIHYEVAATDEGALFSIDEFKL